MQATNYRCPCCGAALAFGSESQKLDCPACGNSFSLESVEQAAQIQIEDTRDEQMHWQQAQNAGFDSTENSHVRAYRCPSCGAGMLLDETAAASECVYCGNPSVLPGVLTGVYRPDGVIPFQKSKQEAQAALRRHCKGKKLLPTCFMDESRLEKITGVYVPFWLFECEAEADMTYNAQKVSVRREGQYEVTRTAHYLVRRGGHMDFKGVPVDGSSKMEDTLMESIEPFDSEKMKEFTVAYLSGYQAQRHDVSAESCQPRANARIRESVQALMRDTVKGYSTVIPANTQIDLQHGRVRQILMPVWLLNTRWQDKTYTFAMNGQTGRFVGDLPTDKGKLFRWLLGLFFGIGAGGYALCYLLASLGVL